MKFRIEFMWLFSLILFPSLVRTGYSQSMAPFRMAVDGVSEITVEPHNQVVIRVGEYTGELQWQKSKDMLLWSDILGATADTLLFVADSTRYFRAKITLGDCESIHSDTTLIRVNHIVMKLYQPCPGFETVQDIDGNIYRTALIGDQCWMAENLRTSRYGNGDPIRSGYSNEEWINLAHGAYAVYPHDQVPGVNSEEEMDAIYGKLYNWYAVSDPRRLCPKGWRPSESHDIDELIGFIGVSRWRVGTNLKSCAQVYSSLGSGCDQDEHPRWNFGCADQGLDTYGFSALPAGQRSWQGRISGIGFLGSWWHITEQETNSQRAQGFGLDTHSSLNINNSLQKTDGRSVRCIRIAE